MACFGHREFFPATYDQIIPVGRVDADGDVLRLNYGMCGSTIRFSGTSLSLRLRSGSDGQSNTVGVRIDGGTEMVVACPADGKWWDHPVAIGLPWGEHEAHIYRRSAVWRGALDWAGLSLDNGEHPLEPPAQPGLKLEFYGDSVLGGEAVEHLGCEGQTDDEARQDSFTGPDDRASNAYWGYGAIVSRALGAQTHLQGIGGLPLLDGTGWYGYPPGIGLETTFDKACPLAGQTTPWDFAKFKPNAVVIGVGQNDANNGHPEDPAFRERWVSTYLRILSRLATEYGPIPFLLITTVLNHDSVWDDMLDEVAAEFGPTAFRLRFQRNGSATPGHPRWGEQMEMAEELAPFIQNLVTEHFRRV